ncbi:gamma-mobile-trio integrase GmtZ [Methylomonas methanica]|uniref:Integrase family protein n=1 Tax=Methylomonas methanica (strain DSM 25384 / MC09) TaxID=857087 RepID=G0A063_METMM|nr:VPA1269 family protein [Methylomonas methanica]AEG01202.1 integrase family protein [Methylomonas methanica MC09]
MNISVNKLPNVFERPATLAELKLLCKRLGINNSVEYRKRYRDIPGLVAHPERVYADEWVSYCDLFDIPEFISYKKLKQTIKPLGLKSQDDYKKFVKNSNNPNFPIGPEGVYSQEWENWYRFLGKEEPFKPQFIAPKYKVWAEKIDEFMKQALGGGTKITLLCRFVRIFIEKHDKSATPQELLTKKKVVIKPFRDELEKLPTDNMRRNIILAVNEFLDYIIENDLTLEDDETGEIVRVMEARNPFSLLSNDQSISNPVRSESTKPCLQYHFVRKAQSWIVPDKARNFKDLTHLHQFDTDWIKISQKQIDYSDPDCVVRKQGNQYFIWSPIDWIHTYALTKVPLRGRQIAYNDSGEGDLEIADIDEKGAILWVKNTGSLAGTTKSQSFVKKLADGNLGMFVTTNKTNNHGLGYSIPWIPEDLAYWLVKLRKWQQKYNAIDKPTPWSVCKRTHLNELQLKAKGVNCFLFRAFADCEPKNVGSALTNRLAAALHHIQPSNLQLSELNGSNYYLSNYRSKYTPHSMRVSLITAYVMEMGMPIEIVMKVVGHSSIVMSIYYCKVSQQDIRQRLEEGEKRALQSKAQATQRLIEQNKLESVKNQLIAKNEDLLASLTNEVPAGNFIFRDYGICPFAASRCEDGGEVIGGTQVNAPTPSGYLGMQNCLRCRHFITGPAFLGGLLSLTNEILLQSNEQAEVCCRLQEKIDQTTEAIEELERQEYVSNLKKLDFDATRRDQLEVRQRKLESEYESAAKKMDMLLCDLQAAYQLVKLSQSIVNELKTEESKSLSLLKMPESEMRIEIAEVSHFQQLHEVCENATIYESANPGGAIAPRSQLLDRMALFNDISPRLFTLSKDEQLEVGNQLVALFKARLKSWSRVDELVNCEIRIDDLLGQEKIERSEIELITMSQIQISTRVSS